MRVLAFDLASVTGCAVGNIGAPPTAWSVDLGKGALEERRYSRLLTLTASLIAREKPDLIAIEAVIGGPDSSQFLVGLVAIVRGVAANRGVPVKNYNLSAIRKHFLGRAPQVRDFPGVSKYEAKRQIKNMVVERCRLLKWTVDGHDAADAAALWDYACALARSTTAHQSTPLFAGAGK